ncbi:hypothetical protein J1P26_22625 [Neobacillus sp. MM2021_6]|uniref:hypothetical protein n=1 Tax=Bacillaceae TaxID=186817 RepID=UPI00140A36DA|nr:MULTISPECIES: hypothetical protein [Bacillaceae]MBO0962493.1 hypothetical protein [Neobacillus sp. MM2021_6]
MVRQSPKHLNRLLLKASEKENENLIFDLWKSLYPKMMMGQIEFIAFSDFKEKLSKKQTSDISYEEIEKEMDLVISAYEGQVK